MSISTWHWTLLHAFTIVLHIFNAPSGIVPHIERIQYIRLHTAISAGRTTMHAQMICYNHTRERLQVMWQSHKHTRKKTVGWDDTHICCSTRLRDRTETNKKCLQHHPYIYAACVPKLPVSSLVRSTNMYAARRWWSLMMYRRRRHRHQHRRRLRIRPQTTCCVCELSMST